MVSVTSGSEPIDVAALLPAPDIALRWIAALARGSTFLSPYEVGRCARSLAVEVLALRTEVERLRAALVEISEYGGGDGGDWVECCEIARLALAGGGPDE